MANQAAWLKAAKEPNFTIEKADMPVPKADEIIIRNRATAINPVDAGVKLGVVPLAATTLPDDEPPMDYPIVLGLDIAGEVTAVGSGVTRFKPGDRVIALMDRWGGFQLFCAAKQTLATHLPKQVSYADGCVLPLAISVAAVSLFEPHLLALRLPRAGGPPVDQNKTILVWGGSTSVGSCAIQLARAAGYKVIATASEANLDYCVSLGAERAFDRNSDNIIDDIVAAIKDSDFAGAFAAHLLGDTILKCAQVVGRANGVKMVATVAPPGMPLPADLPTDVQYGYNFGTSLKDSEVGQAIWGSWLTAALDDGSILCKPDPMIIGNGLDHFQAAVDTMASGVSAQKLVVTLQE